MVLCNATEIRVRIQTIVIMHRRLMRLECDELLQNRVRYTWWIDQIGQHILVERDEMILV